MNGCTVCGSTATIVRDPLTPLCQAHEFVCSLHLEDPCPICDTT